MKRSPIARQSKKREREDREYSRERKKFLEENRVCQARVPDICGLLANQVQHKRGRVGADYLDRSLWLAVCGRCHEYIESHRLEAIERGWALPRIGRGDSAPEVAR